MKLFLSLGFLFQWKGMGESKAWVHELIKIEASVLALLYLHFHVRTYFAFIFQAIPFMTFLHPHNLLESTSQTKQNQPKFLAWNHNSDNQILCWNVSEKFRHARIILSASLWLLSNGQGFAFCQISVLIF